MNREITTLIIGAGPAGLTTAIQLQRYALPYILVEKDRVGGLLLNANLVENYPGFPRGVSGPKLINLFERQLKQTHVPITKDEISSVIWNGSSYSIKGQDSYQSKILVIASGTKPKRFPVEIPDTAKNKVFSDVLPLLGVRNKHVLIVGSGDAAFDHALNLTKNGNSVTILNRGKQVKCLELLKKRADADPGIKYRTNTAVSQINSAENGISLKILFDTEEIVCADYLIFAIGRDPQLDFLTNSVRRNEKMLKESGRLYLIGDVCNGLLRQTAIAAGDGMRAAMGIYLTIKEGAL